MVQHLADQRGLSVLPYDKRGHHEGKRLFCVGTAVFYIYNDVVFLETQAKGAAPGERLPNVFLPVAVDVLLAAASKPGK